MLSGAVAAPPAAAAPPETSSGTAPAETVTLITGDVVTVAGDRVSVRRAAGTREVVTLRQGQDVYVVPDQVEVVLNHRFAPDRTPAEAEAHVRAVVAPWLEPGDEVELTECAPAAAPAHTHPLIASLVARNDLEVRAKLGWTDVARFAAVGVPAANFGPGDATLAHTREEHLDRAPLETVWRAIAELLQQGPAAP